METFDVVVIGGGPAGETVAGRCAEGGLTVALVERELVGGECSYWGCVPSKALVRPGDVLAAARRVPGAAGAVAGGPDPMATFATRDRLTGGWDDAGALPWLADRDIALVRGHARLAGPRTVRVAGGRGPARRLRARRAVVLATGSSPAMPPVPGLAEARPWDNRGATSAKEVPRRLLVLGGGAIGVEMAQAFRRLGSESVTLIEGAARLLVREEPFAGEEVRRALEADGVDVRVDTRVASVARDGDGPVLAEVDGGDRFVADEILVATGRRPATGDAGLDRVGLEPGAFVAVDDRMRATGVAGGWLYAVGDCNGRALLTHMGKYQGRVAADVILGRESAAEAGDRIVPRVTFTDPQVCAVGMTEAQALDAGVDVRCVRHATGGVAGASLLGEPFEGTSQLVVDAAAGVVVGATFVGPGVQELLHSATVAIAGRVPLERLVHAVPAFPTVSEVWLRLLEAYGL